MLKPLLIKASVPLLEILDEPPTNQSLPSEIEQILAPNPPAALRVTTKEFTFPPSIISGLFESKFAPLALVNFPNLLGIGEMFIFELGKKTELLPSERLPGHTVAG